MGLKWLSWANSFHIFEDQLSQLFQKWQAVLHLKAGILHILSNMKVSGMKHSEVAGVLRWGSNLFSSAQATEFELI